jgi:NAD(P)-dependent dehydrogenase (short-subunit alcohol dehydrogenase family)
MPVDLTDHVVLVTGGARGIGARVAVEAARAGAIVAVGYLSSGQEAADLVERIRAEGGTADAFAADLSDLSQVRHLIAEIERRKGRIDGLVNSAAVMATGDFLETSEAEWERVIRDDLYSVVFACQAALPGMLARGSGAIVNIASRLAVAGAADAAHYAAAKAGVVALTRSLALAYASRGIRVNAIAPGTTNTDMGREVIESPAGRERATRIPTRRYVEPQEIASAAIFLLSEAATGFAGQMLHINGGELMS